MISVVVITKNEEDMVRTCLESVRWADEIVVADNGSDDKTMEIVKKYTDQIVAFNGQDFATLRNRATEKTRGDWILYVDADERVLEPLREEVLELVKKTDKSAYALSRRNIIFGREERYGPYRHDWVIRLIKKSSLKEWVGRVHEYPKFDGALGYTRYSLLHLTHRNIDHFVIKSLEWSKIDAKLRLDAGHPKMTKWRFVRILITETFNQGIKRRGFLGGTIGMIDAMLQVFFFYITYVRLWELQQPKPLDDVYRELDENLLKEKFRY